MNDCRRSILALHSVAEMREQFLAFAHRLASETGVRSVASDLDTRIYDGEVWVECFVEAELITGDFTVWWLDIREHQGELLLEATVFLQHKAGKDDIARGPVVRTNDQDFPVQLHQVLAELLNAPQQYLTIALGLRNARDRA